MKRVVIQKYEGDDRYSWALFVDGRPRYTGMGKSEAEYRRYLVRREICPDEMTNTEHESYVRSLQ